MSRDEIDEVLAESSRLVERGEHRDNESLMRYALVRFPDSPELALHAAHVLQLSAPTRAIQLAQRAARLKPDDPTTLFHAASLLTDLDQFESARNYARRLGGLVTETFPFIADYVVLVGRLQMEKGNLAQAEKALTLVFEREPDTRGTGAVLGELYLRQGRLDEALEVVRVAQAHQPDETSLVALERRIHDAAEGGSG